VNAGPAARFWAFSTRVYAAPEVKTACLDLQNMLGIDVNVALWCAFAASEGLDPAGALDEAKAISDIWSGAVVKRLRAARDALKTPLLAAEGLPEPDRLALRRQVLAAELEAERLEQHVIAALVERCPPLGAASAREAAALALERLTQPQSGAEKLQLFLQAVFTAAEME
jgi:uncharacterized protein (TIGR02444 family)